MILRRPATLKPLGIAHLPTQVTARRSRPIRHIVCIACVFFTTSCGEAGTASESCSVDEASDGTVGISCPDQEDQIIVRRPSGDACFLKQLGPDLLRVTCPAQGAVLIEGIDNGRDCTASSTTDGGIELSCDDETTHGISARSAGEECQVVSGPEGAAWISCNDSIATTFLAGLTHPVVVAGVYATYGLRMDGSVRSWGGEFAIVRPPQETRFLAIGPTAAGVGCGLRPTGQIECWGDLSCRGTSNPEEMAPPDLRFSSMSYFGCTICGITADTGSIVCWGDNICGTVSESPVGEGFKQLDVSSTSCAIAADDTVACWGGPPSGYCTSPDSLDWGQGSPPPGAFRLVSTGGYNTCGIRVDGTIACWGTGQTDDQTDIGPPYNFGQSMAPTGEFVALDATLYTVCAIRTDGTLTCWGRGDESGWSGGHENGIPPPGRFIQISMGALHACGVRAGDYSVVCWGAGQVAVDPCFWCTGAGQSIIPSDFPRRESRDPHVETTL